MQSTRTKSLGDPSGKPITRQSPQSGDCLVITPKERCLQQIVSLGCYQAVTKTVTNMLQVRARENQEEPPEAGTGGRI